HAGGPVPHRMSETFDARGAGGSPPRGAGSAATSPVAIAAVETSSIAQGLVTADAMVKQADVEVLHATVLSPGRYWIVVGGAGADVRSAHRPGGEVAGAPRAGPPVVTA